MSHDAGIYLKKREIKMQLPGGVTAYEVESNFPLRRDLTEPLPRTPSDFDPHHFPPTIAAVKALLSPTLKAQFEQEIDQTPFQRLPDLVMDWGEEASNLHIDGTQQALEAFEDDDKEKLKTLFSPLPNQKEDDPAAQND